MRACYGVALYALVSAGFARQRRSSRMARSGPRIE